MTYDDLDAVATTFVSAFDPGVLWTYIYQFRDWYPDYHRRCHREELEKYSRDMDATDYAMVIVPRDDPANSARSVALWKMIRRGEESLRASRWTASPPTVDSSVIDSLVMGNARHGVEQTEMSRQRLIEKRQAHVNEEQQGVTDIELSCSLHLDMNLIRALHISPQLQAVEKEYIEDKYEYQLYLGLLATHPDWDGHGFGAAQVQWGMELAKAEAKRLSLLEGRQVQVPVTLLATPAGYPLYKSLGFESVANVTLSLLGNFNGGTTWYEYMRWFGDE